VALRSGGRRLRLHATAASGGGEIRSCRAEERLMGVLPRENVYGHLQRVDWLRGDLQPEDRVVEFGCGTGRLITLPLRASGYDIVGVDLDQRSIDHGRGLLREA